MALKGIKTQSSKKKSNEVGAFVGVAPSGIDKNGVYNFKDCGMNFYCFIIQHLSQDLHTITVKRYGPRKERGECVHTRGSVNVVMDTANSEPSLL